MTPSSVQIGNLLDNAGVSPAYVFGQSGAGMAGETAHVHLVDDGAGGRPAERRIAFPIVCVRIYYDTLHRGGGVIAAGARGFAAVLFGNNHAAAVRVEENFGGIESQPLGGSKGPYTR